MAQNAHEQGVKKSETLPGIMRQRAEFGARASLTHLSVTIKRNWFMCPTTDKPTSSLGLSVWVHSHSAIQFYSVLSVFLSVAHSTQLNWIAECTFSSHLRITEYTLISGSVQLSRVYRVHSSPWVCPELNVCHSWVDPRLVITLVLFYKKTFWHFQCHFKWKWSQTK